MMGVEGMMQAFHKLAPALAQSQAVQQPMFTSEGPQYYGQAYQHNAPFATAGSYQTQLPAQEEQQFRHWVAQNKVPFDPSAGTVDYDMRGYYQAMKAGQTEPWKGQGSHFPDTYKTPYDTTFSAESKYAKPGTPFVWKGNTLIDTRTGQVIFGGGQ